MRTSVILGAALVLALAGQAGAHEKHGKRAKVYKAHLEAAAAATLAGIPDARGRAHLKDGAKNDKVSLHMKGLKPGETYLWHVHQASGEGDPCAAGSTVANPTPYPGFTYRELKARPSGNASSKGKSTTFPVTELDIIGDYYVNVHLQDGTVVACGVLERKKHHGHQHHGGDDHGKGKGKDHGNGNGDGHDDD